MAQPLPRRILAATLELAQADLRSYDLRGSMRALAADGVNVFVVFGIGYLGGEAYYPSRIAPQHPHLGDRDFLQEATEAAAELDVSCIAYVNSLFGGADAWREHPDWVQRRADDSTTDMADAKAMCPLSPYGERILAAVEEIAERYPVDGLYFDEPSFQSWCACPNCQAAFKAETGFELPRAAASTDAWWAFVDWRYEKIARFIADARAAFTAHRSDAVFFCQHAFPMTSTVLPQMRKLFEGMLPQRVPETAEGWSRTLFYGQRVERQVDSLDMLSAELWRRFADRPVWWPGAVVSYLRSIAGTRPVVAFLEYPDFPWSLRRIPDDELAYVVADVAAAGGHSWFPLYAPGHADLSGWSVAGRVNAAVADLLPSEAAPVADVAVGYSPASADEQSLADVERDYLDGFLGVIQLLREAHIPYRVVSLDRLERRALDGVQVLVVPGAVRLSGEPLDLIGEFVDSGGAALFTGALPASSSEAAAIDRAAVQRLAGVRDSGEQTQLGIAYLQWEEEALAAGAARLFPVRGCVPVLVVDDAEVIGSVAHGFELFEAPPEDAQTVPVVTRRRSGGGVVLTSTVDIGLLARRFRAPDVDELLQRLLDAAGWRSTITVEAPAGVAAIPWRAGDEWTVFLVNRTGLEEQGRAVPVGPVRMRPSTSQQFVRLTVEAAGADGVTVETDRDGSPLVVVPSVGAWAVLTIREER